MEAFCNYLQQPQNQIKTIHVAGTNGKGSTAHMMASVLQQHGYQVGLYTSPHLKDFRERIKINGHLIEKDFVVDFVQNHHHYFELHSLSFFEVTVGLAFAYFSKKRVDIAVIEVGMGGVWLGAAPYLLFIPTDFTQDKPTSPIQKLLDGWGVQDTHEVLNSLRWGPDGWLYGTHGVFTHSNVGKPGATDQERTKINAGVWRFHPKTHVFEVFAEDQADCTIAQT